MDDAVSVVATYKITVSHHRRLKCRGPKMQDYKQRISQYIKAPQRGNIDEFLKLNSYVPGAYDKPEAFQELNRHMSQFEQTNHGGNGSECNRVFYMALPPSVYIDVAKGLKQNCYSPNGINRVIIEKPFGKDLESYRHLQSEISKLWREEEARLCQESYTVLKLTRGLLRSSASTIT